MPCILEFHGEYILFTWLMVMTSRFVYMQVFLIELERKSDSRHLLSGIAAVPGLLSHYGFAALLDRLPVWPS